jgi:hypothetical protein
MSYALLRTSTRKPCAVILAASDPGENVAKTRHDDAAIPLLAHQLGNDAFLSPKVSAAAHCVDQAHDANWGSLFHISWYSAKSAWWRRPLGEARAGLLTL